MRGFRSTASQIATGLAGGGVFNGNANQEVITVLFLNAKYYSLFIVYYLLFMVMTRERLHIFVHVDFI